MKIAANKIFKVKTLKTLLFTFFYIDSPGKLCIWRLTEILTVVPISHRVEPKNLKNFFF